MYIIQELLLPFLPVVVLFQKDDEKTKEALARKYVTIFLKES